MGAPSGILEGDSKPNNLSIANTNQYWGIWGWESNDTLTGNDSNNDLFGWTGDDVIYAWKGNDWVKGEGDNRHLQKLAKYFYHLTSTKYSNQT